jgi:iron(III) transport system permease protein
MQHSLALAFSVMLLTVGTGVPLGIILSRTNLPFRRLFTILFVTPLLIPPYIIAVAWSDLLGRGGLLSGIISSSVIESAENMLFGLPGCTLVLSSVFLPIPMLFTMVFARAVNPRLEEEGLLFCSRGCVLRRITLPLIIPGITMAAVLVFLLSFGEFSVPNFLRYSVFPVESFTQFSAFYNFKAATAAAVPLVAVTLIALLLEAIFMRGRKYNLHSAEDARALPPAELGSWRSALTALVAVLVFVVVILPAAVLLIQAGGINIYKDALRMAGGSLRRSLLYAACGATLLMLIGFFTGYMIHTAKSFTARSADTLTLFLLALPGTVIGIGLIAVWNRPQTNIIYGTPLIIIIGYIAKYTATNSRISAAALSHIPASMEEAAQVAGAGWFHRIGLIVAPLIWPALLTSWLIGYIFSLRDTGITMLVYPAGHDTLPIRIFTLMANGSPQLIAALCIIMIFITLVPAGVLWAVYGITNYKHNGYH